MTDPRTRFLHRLMSGVDREEAEAILDTLKKHRTQKRAATEEALIQASRTRLERRQLEEDVSIEAALQVSEATQRQELCSDEYPHSAGAGVEAGRTALSPGVRHLLNESHACDSLSLATRFTEGES